MKRIKLVKIKSKLHNVLVWLSVIAAVIIGGWALYSLLDGMLKQMVILIVAIIWLLMAAKANAV